MKIFRCCFRVRFDTNALNGFVNKFLRNALHTENIITQLLRFFHGSSLLLIRVLLVLLIFMLSSLSRDLKGNNNMLRKMNVT